MIADLFVERLAADLALTPGVDIFSGQGVGDVNVILYELSTTPIGQLHPAFRTSLLAANVSGYAVAAGKELSEKILAILEPMQGVYEPASGEEYYLYAVIPVMLPLMLKDELGRPYWRQTFTANYRVKFLF